MSLIWEQLHACRRDMPITRGWPQVTWVNHGAPFKHLFNGKLKINSRNFVASRFTILHVRYSSRDSYLNCTMGKCVPFRPKVRYLAKHLKSEEGNLLLSSLPSSLQASVLLHNYVTRRRLLMKGILLGIFCFPTKNSCMSWKLMTPRQYNYYYLKEKFRSSESDSAYIEH